MLLAIVSSHSNMSTWVMTRNTFNLTTNYKVNSLNPLLFLVAADCNITLTVVSTLTVVRTPQIAAFVPR